MSNPVLRESAFERDISSGETMTVNGAIHKTALLLAICAGSAWFAWQTPNSGFLVGGLLIGFILALVISFKPTTAPYLSPVYAVAKGLAVGTISSMYAGAYNGIILQTLMLTGGVFCTMLGLYHTRIIRPTRTFFNVIVGATGGICLVYIVNIAFSMFGHPFFFISGNGPMAIGFSLVVCAIAALNLILDFAIIEGGAEAHAPKYMEWYSAFGLLVTLVWLYLEILRLLAKSRR